MTQTEVTPNPILEAARRLQEAKLAAVQGVIDTRSRIDAVVDQLTAAQREDAVAYQKALKAGWTEAELRQVGIVPPARKPPGRPRSGNSSPRSGNALVDAQQRREAEASVALDRDETHVVGEPVGAGA